MAIFPCTIDLGDGAVLMIALRDTVTGDLVDPDTVSVEVHAPGGTIVTYTYPEDIARLSLGRYQLAIPPDALAEVGHWTYAWIATGTGAGTEPGTIDVLALFP